MRVILSLALIALAQARIVDKKCDGVLVHNINHEKEILKEDLDSPYQLVIDYDTNTLFFSYTAHEDEVFRSCYFNLKNNEFGKIPGIAGGFANAVDNKNHIVFLGGRDGVYQFNYDTKKANKLPSPEHNIWQMFYKNDLYYSRYPDEHVYVYRNGNPIKLPEISDTKALLVAIDNNNNIIYSNSSGLFYYKKGKGKSFILGDYNLNGITADINGNVYFSTPDGIFSISDKYVVERLVTIDNIYGLAIEADNNIIYASENAIVRLKPSKENCVTQEKKATNEYNNL